MTTTTEDLRLAADFAPATYEDWRKLVDGVLKGAPFEKLVGKTSDGIKIDPIYPRAKGASPVAGRAAAAPWQIMQRIDHPDAAQANAQALHDLENGATGLEFEFAGGPGARGFGIADASRETLARLCEGIYLRRRCDARAQSRARARECRRKSRRYHRSPQNRSGQGRPSFQLSGAQHRGGAR